MKIHKGKTFAQAYKKSLKSLLEEPEFVSSPRNMKVNEDLNVCLEITDPYECMFANERRSTQFKYISAEFLYYYLGRNDAEYISQYAKMWDSIKNEDGTINSAYGHLLFNTKNEHGFTQYDWAFTSLVNDIDTRQAIVHFNLPKHQKEKNSDFVCSMYGNFHVRNNKLYFTIHMRSNDAILGTPTDVPFFCSLQIQMYQHLKSFYPTLEMGSYTHIANSYHIYERHYDMVKEMLQYRFRSVRLPDIKNDLIDSKGTPTEDLITVDDFIHNPTAFTGSIFVQDTADLMFWVLSNLKKTVIPK